MLSWSLNYRTDVIELKEKIGGGAQAEIFKAKCGLDDVAVKRFLDSTHKSTKQEVEIIKNLTHVHIVQFYHVHHNMIVMEHVEGGSLADAIKRKDLTSWEVKTQIAKDISLGLAYLHSQGIIHADIKSSNILLTLHKEAKICDFGLAMRDGETGVRGGGGGTLQWMAPELLQNPPLHTSKSDVYALGMVMWEMASESTQPYRGHTPHGVTSCILNGILEEYPDDTPKAYATCIQMCWRSRPTERPAAAEMLPDAIPSSQGKIVEEPRSARDHKEKSHFLKALEQYIKPSETMRLTEILKNGGMLPRKGRTMNWFDTSTGGNESARAMFKMGSMYYDGREVEQDHKKAMEWYLAASEAGVPLVMLKISQMYQHGRGVEQDDRKATSWYRKAEETMNEQEKFNNCIVHHDNGVSEHHTRTMDWFNNTFGDGVTAAKISIGNTYYHGKDLKQDYGKALEWYRKASNAGNASAMFMIGAMYRDGDGVEQDYRIAMEWYLKASDAGDDAAMLHIGMMYYQGEGVAQDNDLAMEWLLKASDLGNDVAMALIGDSYHHGVGIEQDYDKAMDWYLEASAVGNEIASCCIGVMYQFGQGVEQDYGKAMEFYLDAADAGNAIAMCRLGNMYVGGLGVEKDDGRALEWYLKACDAGDVASMTMAGIFYHSGRVVKQDYSQALELYRKAADAGEFIAMANLCGMYYSGEGVERDYGKAMELAHKASEGGIVAATFLVGLMFNNGEGVDQDCGQAMEWYLRASEGGSSEAMLRIGDLYRDGKGCLKDQSLALEWYVKACEAGSAEANARIKEMQDE